LIFPLLYNGPVNYFARLVREEKIILEQFDSYHKQSYRNRCRIMGPNGLLTLSIPVKRQRGRKNLFKEIRIDYETPWNKIHWKSLVAAYAASPFFEFISDDLVVFYERRFDFLVDLNIRMLSKTMDFLGLDIPVSLTSTFELSAGTDDPREFIHPKANIPEADPLFSPEVYHQVFSDKHGFQANLSILDLLFNEGLNSLTILKKSLRTADPS
jgi:hypothetical protein